MFQEVYIFIKHTYMANNDNKKNNEHVVDQLLKNMPTLKIWHCIKTNKKTTMTTINISKKTRIPRQTTYRMLNKLVKMGLIEYNKTYNASGHLEKIYHTKIKKICI